MNQQISTKNKVFSIVFLIWFVASIVGLIYFSKVNVAICLMIFGQYFLVFGMFALVKGKLSMRNIWLLLFPILGISVMAGAGIKLWGNERWMGYLEVIIPVFALSLFSLAGITLTVMGFVTQAGLKKCCTMLIQAQCIDRQMRYGKRGRWLYSPTFSFYFNGNHYEVNNNMYSNMNRTQIGDYKELFVNPENPEEFYTQGDKNYLFIGIFGIIFAILPLWGLYLYLTKG